MSIKPERVTHKSDRYVHWSGSGLLGHETMCGYVDTPGGGAVKMTRRKVTCAGCLHVARMFAALFATTHPID